jgi:hypothetical protein
VSHRDHHALAVGGDPERQQRIEIGLACNVGSGTSWPSTRTRGRRRPATPPTVGWGELATYP